MQTLPFSRILVVNRGEPAVRFLRALKDYNYQQQLKLQKDTLVERDNTVKAVRSILVYTDSDEGNSFLQLADSLYYLGPANDDKGRSNYLNHDKLKQALKDTGADAVWAGWGFVSEDPVFVSICEALRVTFIGPPSQVMRQLGEKGLAKQQAERYGLPVLPWAMVTDKSIKNNTINMEADKIGYPLLVKAVAGGGGRGIRRVDNPTELISQISAAQAEGLSAFGNDTVMLEKLLTRTRHLEVQIVADQHGTIWSLGVRDCSVQRRKQKLLEETPAPYLPAQLLIEIEAAAVKLAQGVGYQNVGTVEFLLDTSLHHNEDSGGSIGKNSEYKFYFLEVNPRLQVEHTVTEAVYGVDLVQLQLSIAAGERLGCTPKRPHGCAIEARLNAEDPGNGALPAPGVIACLTLPSGPGIRVDSGFSAGDTIPSEFDSMIAKVIAWGENRVQALARLSRALRECELVVGGCCGNRAQQLFLVNHASFHGNAYHTGWVDEEFGGQHLKVSHSHHTLEMFERALATAAILRFKTALHKRQRRFLSSAASGRPQISDAFGEAIILLHEGSTLTIEVARIAHHHYKLCSTGMNHGLPIEVVLQERGENTGSVSFIKNKNTSVSLQSSVPFQSQSQSQSQCQSRWVMAHNNGHMAIDLDGEQYRFAAKSNGTLRAVAPAMVLAVHVVEGDIVEIGTPLLTLEAMKMEMPLAAETAGTILSVLVNGGDQVASGTPLLTITPIEPALHPNAQKAAVLNSGQDTTEASAEASAEARAEARAEAKNPVEQQGVSGHFTLSNISYETALIALRQSMLGFDIDPKTAAKHLESAVQQEQTSVAKNILYLEDRIIENYVDLLRLYDSRPLEAEGGPSSAECLTWYYRAVENRSDGLPKTFSRRLNRVLGHYSASSTLSKTSSNTMRDNRETLEDKLLLAHQSYHRSKENINAIIVIINRRLLLGGRYFEVAPRALRILLNQLVEQLGERSPQLRDIALQLRYRCFDEPLFAAQSAHSYTEFEVDIERLLKIGNTDKAEHRTEEFSVHETKSTAIKTDLIRHLAQCSEPIAGVVAEKLSGANDSQKTDILEVMLRRFHADKVVTVEALKINMYGHLLLASGVTVGSQSSTHLIAGALISLPDLVKSLPFLHDELNARISFLTGHQFGGNGRLDIFTYLGSSNLLAGNSLEERVDGNDLRQFHLWLREAMDALESLPLIERITVTILSGKHERAIDYFTFIRDNEGYLEAPELRGIHSLWADRLELNRMSNFNAMRLPSPNDTYLYHVIAKENSADERLFAFVDVRNALPVKTVDNRRVKFPHLSYRFHAALFAMRDYQSSRAGKKRLRWNRITLAVRSPIDCSLELINEAMERLAPAAFGQGIEKATIRARIGSAALKDCAIQYRFSESGLASVEVTSPTKEPIRVRDLYAQKVMRSERRNCNYPYEVVRTLVSNTVESNFKRGQFTEYDLDVNTDVTSDLLEIVDRPAGNNLCNVVVGVIKNYNARYPEGFERVLLLGDPSFDMGSLAEAECRRIIAALNLAEQKQLPVDWFPVSAGAKISLNSGTENLDWTARVLRRIIEFTQSGQLINIVVDGICVGAQSYWNAEATMLMHCKGALIMTKRASMVLTGKKALAYAGAVSADTHEEIGGVERIMGPNGEADYIADNLSHACHILDAHHAVSYSLPGETSPRPKNTSDLADRDICDFPYHSRTADNFSKVGDIFSAEHNQSRKRPFAIRAVLDAVIDQGETPLERWQPMRNAEMAVVWETHIGGYPVSLIGIESKPLPRTGGTQVGDGPSVWSGGTLFPLASKKVARAINVASGIRPVVVLANLSGFDGSPESMRKLQLEYGAEIGRSVVNFKGPILFCVISRYHGGAYVVFSKALNDGIYASALQGSYASVIGGAPAAAVVLQKEVRDLITNDPQMKMLEVNKGLSAAERAKQIKLIHAEKETEVARQFEEIHTVERAKKVGSLDEVISPNELRQYLISILKSVSQEVVL